MKLHILSDLHNEFEPVRLGPLECDAVILAGDTDIGTIGARWAISNFKKIPILYIAGNHEYYHGKYDEVSDQLRDLSQLPNFHFLENNEIILKDVRILASTLWTDYRLFGPGQYIKALQTARQSMNDFQIIAFKEKSVYRILHPHDTILFHQRSIKYLTKKLSEPFEGATVVVTHHLPSKQSVTKFYKNDILSASFASNLDRLIKKYQPNLWIHGHTHTNFDYFIGDTRIICNPRGYSPFGLCKKFNPNLIVEL